MTSLGQYKYKTKLNYYKIVTNNITQAKHELIPHFIQNMVTYKLHLFRVLIRLL